MPLLLRLAFRNVLRQRRRSFLTAMSMAGGYLMCVMSFSMVEGSYNNAIRIFTEDQTGHIQVHKGDYLRKPKIFTTINDQAKIRSVFDHHSEIVGYAPRVYVPALAYAGTDSSPAQVIGVDPQLEPTTSRLKEKLAEGRWLSTQPDSGGYYDALIGQGIADALGLGLGGEIILISQGADGSVANDLYHVVGIVGTNRSLDRINVVLPITAAQDFATLQGRVHEYAIRLDNILDARDVTLALQEELPELKVSPWQEVRESFYRSMQADKEGNKVTLGIVLFIVFIGVLNTVLMSVLERTREFGVLKAIGSRPYTIASLITLETSILAGISLMIGFVMALPLVIWLKYVGIEMPAPIDMGGVTFSYMTGEISLEIFVVPMLIVYAYALIVSIPPGIRAARVAPVQAMRTF